SRPHRSDEPALPLYRTPRRPRQPEDRHIAGDPPLVEIGIIRFTSARVAFPAESRDPWHRRLCLLKQPHGLPTMISSCGGTMGPGFRRGGDRMSGVSPSRALCTTLTVNSAKQLGEGYIFGSSEGL